MKNNQDHKIFDLLTKPRKKFTDQTVNVEGRIKRKKCKGVRTQEHQRRSEKMKRKDWCAEGRTTEVDERTELRKCRSPQRFKELRKRTK